MAELTNAISHMMDVSDYKALSNVKVSRVSIQPENKPTVTMTNGQNQDLFLAFPSRPSTFLDSNSSYLTFTYTMKGTSAGSGRSVAFANGAQSVIKNLLNQVSSTKWRLCRITDRIAQCDLHKSLHLKHFIIKWRGIINIRHYQVNALVCRAIDRRKGYVFPCS